MDNRLLVKGLIAGLLCVGSVAAHADAAGGNGCGWGNMLFEGQRGMAPHFLATTTNGTSGNATFGMTSGTNGCDTSVKLGYGGRSMLAMNGMLDNIAAKLRPDEVVAAKKARQERRRRADDAAKTAVKPAESPNGRLGETQEAAAAEGEKSATAQTHGARNDAARAEARSAEPQEARADGKD